MDVKARNEEFDVRRWGVKQVSKGKCDGHVVSTTTDSKKHSVLVLTYGSYLFTSNVQYNSTYLMVPVRRREKTSRYYKKCAGRKTPAFPVQG